MCIRDWFTRSHPSEGENRTRNIESVFLPKLFVGKADQRGNGQER
jgi:hypothetical protein